MQPQPLALKAKLYIAVLFLGALAMVYLLLPSTDFQGVSWPTLILFFLLIFLSDSFTVKMPNNVIVSVSYAVTFATIFLFPPLLVIAVTVLGDLFSLRKGRTAANYIFNAAQLALASGAAALAFRSIFPGELLLNIPFFFAALAALTTYFLLNCTFIVLIIALAEDEKPYAVWLTNFKGFFSTSFLSMAPLGMMLALIYIYMNFWGVILFLIPLLIARHTFISYINIRETFLDTMKSLSVAIDAKDPCTRGHSARVADYAVSLAREMRWPADKIELFRFIALIHDVGKIAIPESILKKTDILSGEEYDQMKYHSEAGFEMVRHVKFFAGGSDIIRHHHERWDGLGYPDGLVGEQIPAGARLLTVADAYDAMTSDRPYRKALSPLPALQELRAGAGYQFDPRAVEAFTRIFPKISTGGQQSRYEIPFGELAAAKETETAYASALTERGDKAT